MCFIVLAASFMVLQSFQSCREELVEITINNMSEDTIYAHIRDNDASVYPKGLDFFEGVRSSFEWKKISPNEKASSYSMYLENVENKSWKVWIIKNSDMADMPLEDVIDKGLLDSLCSLKKVYTYDDMKSINFCIRFYYRGGAKLKRQ